MLPAQPNKSIIDGLSVLQAVASAKQPARVRSLARQLGLEPTRVNRLLKTLGHIGLARQTDSLAYEPGPALHILAAQSLQGSGLLATAFPEIQKLYKEKLIVALGVLWNDQVCYLFHGEPGEPLEKGLGSHQLFPASSSSIGLAIMAGQGNINNMTLAGVKKKGYALVKSTPGTVTLGVAIGSPPYAGIALAGKIERSRIPGLVKKLKSASENIIAALNGNKR